MLLANRHSSMNVETLGEVATAPFVALLFAVLIYFIVVLLEKIKISRIIFGR